MRLWIIALALVGCGSPASSGPLLGTPDAGDDARSLGASDRPDIAPDGGPCELTCLHGCCRVDGTCQSGLDTNACGSGGGACEACPQSGQPYASTFCVPAYIYSDAGAVPVGGHCCAQGRGC